MSAGVRSITESDIRNAMPDFMWRWKEMRGVSIIPNANAVQNQTEPNNNITLSPAAIHQKVKGGVTWEMALASSIAHEYGHSSLRQVPSALKTLHDNAYSAAVNLVYAATPSALLLAPASYKDAVARREGATYAKIAVDSILNNVHIPISASDNTDITSLVRQVVLQKSGGAVERVLSDSNVAAAVVNELANLFLSHVTPATMNLQFSREVRNREVKPGSEVTNIGSSAVYMFFEAGEFLWNDTTHLGPLTSSLINDHLLSPLGFGGGFNGQAITNFSLLSFSSGGVEYGSGAFFDVPSGMHTSSGWFSWDASALEQAAGELAHNMLSSSGSIGSGDQLDFDVFMASTGDWTISFSAFSGNSSSPLLDRVISVGQPHGAESFLNWFNNRAEEMARDAVNMLSIPIDSDNLFAATGDAEATATANGDFFGRAGSVSGEEALAHLEPIADERIFQASARVANPFIEVMAEGLIASMATTAPLGSFTSTRESLFDDRRMLLISAV